MVGRFDDLAPELAEAKARQKAKQEEAASRRAGLPPKPQPWKRPSRTSWLTK